MFKNYFPLCMNLQLFAEGGADGSGATGAVAAPQIGESPAQGTEQTSAATEPTITEEQFKALMKGQFRGIVDKHTKSIVENRLKGTKERLARYEALDPVIGMLSQRYKFDANDPQIAELLTKAVEDDDAFYAEEAEKRGIDVNTMRQISKMERDNAALKKAIAEQESQRKADELLRGWMDEAEQLREVYPSFDLQAEIKNPNFVELMKLPIFNLKTAYEFIHKDEIQAAASQVVAQQVEQRIANRMASNANLPVENGVASASAAVAVRDASSLTKAERDDIIRRVMAGEKVTLGGNLISG